MTQICAIRELRNEIAHEYAADLPRLFAAVAGRTPELLALAERAARYGRTG